MVKLRGVELLEMPVVGIGGLFPKIPINIHDHDYAEKMANPANFSPAVVVKMPNGKTTVITVNDGETHKVGDTVTVLVRGWERSFFYG